MPIYETSSAEQVEWILTDAGCRAAFVETDAHRDLVEQVRAPAPDLEQVWVFDDDALRRGRGAAATASPTTRSTPAAP